MATQIDKKGSACGYALGEDGLAKWSETHADAWIGLLETHKRLTRELEARGIRHIYVDGGITIQQFLQAGLIQRLIITRVPVLIGTGIPLFGPLRRDISLKHVATRQYASGLVQSEYVVAA